MDGFFCGGTPSARFVHWETKNRLGLCGETTPFERQTHVVSLQLAGNRVPLRFPTSELVLPAFLSAFGAGKERKRELLRW